MSTPVYAILSCLAVLTLPFTKALTVDVGFPLKIYEILFFVALVFFFFSHERLPQQVFSRYLVFIFLFWTTAAGSSLFSIWTASDTNTVSYRGGAATDAIMRTAYLAYNIAILVLVFCVSVRFKDMMIRSWLYGMSLAVLYHLYTSCSVLLTGDAFLLPGLERHQMGYLGPWLVPRSGTFEEGNFAGLFYLLSAGLAVYRHKYFFFALALCGVLLSLSTSSLAGLFVFFVGYVLSKRKGLFTKTFLITVALAAAVSAFFLFGIDTKFTDDADASGAVRLNEAITGLQIFYAKPVVGAGLGQYGFLFDSFEWDPAFSIFSTADKHIPNNIYVELLAETGLVGFILFMTFWIRWTFSFSKGVFPSNIFFLSGLAFGIVCMGYPTFNITYLWCFAGLGLATHFHRIASPQRAQRL